VLALFHFIWLHLRPMTQKSEPLTNNNPSLFAQAHSNLALEL
jgi:hypothetical protein